jgi:CDP-glycerol glycerophosphotransferase (TagB/SpsB family)
MIFASISIVNKIIPKRRNKILFYSPSGLADNNKHLFEYLIANQYNMRYEIVVTTSERKIYPYANVRSVGQFRAFLEYLTSSYIYYSHGMIPMIPSKKQIAVQMWHGISFKGYDGHIFKPIAERLPFTYVFASNEFFVPIVAQKFSCDLLHIYICGHPRTDVFYNTDVKYNLGTYAKIVIWLPTFRQSAIQNYTDSLQKGIIPIFTDNELVQLNATLRERDILLIVKIHPVQVIYSMGQYMYTNLWIFTDDEFHAKGYELYRLLRQADALITDYSSVFYDYLLLDRPIGFTVDDVEEYGKKRGWAVENPNELKPGKRIANQSDFYEFLDDLILKRDLYENSRKMINELSNKYRDGKNCKRALDCAGITLAGWVEDSNIL